MEPTSILREDLGKYGSGCCPSLSPSQMEWGHKAVDKEALTVKLLFRGLPSHPCWGPALFQRLEFIINEVGEVRRESAKLATRNTGNQYLTY